MNSDTAIIIPAYNEGKMIRQVLEGVLRQFSVVVCVDDGSADDTATEIAKTKALLLHHPINLGQGAALQTGIEFSRQIPGIKYFVTFDADGQHRLSDAEKMVELLRKGEADILTGSRFLKATSEVPLKKQIILRMAAAFTNIIYGTKLTDAHNGLRAFNKRFADKIKITQPGMAHATEITNLIVQSGLRYKEVPVTVDYTEYSKAKGQSVWNSVNILFDLFFDFARRRK